MEVARKVAAVVASRGPLAVRAAKRTMAEGSALPLAEGLALEHQLFDDLACTKDLQEGIAAFEEKHTPDFRAELVHHQQNSHPPTWRKQTRRS